MRKASKTLHIAEPDSPQAMASDMDIINAMLEPGLRKIAAGWSAEKRNRLGEKFARWGAQLMASSAEMTKPEAAKISGVPGLMNTIGELEPQFKELSIRLAYALAKRAKNKDLRSDFIWGCLPVLAVMKLRDKYRFARALKQSAYETERTGQTELAQQLLNWSERVKMLGFYRKSPKLIKVLVRAIIPVATGYN